MNATQRPSEEGYNQLLDELGRIQIQLNTTKPTNLKALLERQMTVHEAIIHRLTQLALDKVILPMDDLQSIVRPPYVVTFLLQPDGAEGYNITIHNVSYCCQF